MSRSIVFLILLLLSVKGFSVELRPILEGSDRARFSRYLECSGQAEVIVNSQEFRSKVLAYKFTSTNKTSAQVISDMDTGSEILTPEANAIWDWKVGFYYPKNPASKVIGWTNPLS